MTRPALPAGPARQLTSHPPLPDRHDSAPRHLSLGNYLFPATERREPCTCRTWTSSGPNTAPLPTVTGIQHAGMVDLGVDGDPGTHRVTSKESAGRMHCSDRSVPTPVTDSGDDRPILGHGDGFAKLHAHDAVVDVRKSVATTVVTVGGARCSW